MAARPRRVLFWVLGLTLAAVVLALWGSSAFVGNRYVGRVVAQGAAPDAPVALVFGAGLVQGGEPSPVLAARLTTAVELYRSGKVRKILVSGDSSDRHHDETKAMRNYAVLQGVAPADVVGDVAGVSTYDSCYRAKEVFGVQRALLVTQAFHLPRALFIANALGIDAYGVAADEGREGRAPVELRELFSRSLALAMVIAHPRPRLLGEPAPIR